MSKKFKNNINSNRNGSTRSLLHISSYDGWKNYVIAPKRLAKTFHLAIRMKRNAIKKIIYNKLTKD